MAFIGGRYSFLLSQYSNIKNGRQIVFKNIRYCSPKPKYHFYQSEHTLHSEALPPRVTCLCAALPPPSFPNCHSSSDLPFPRSTHESQPVDSGPVDPLPHHDVDPSTPTTKRCKTRIIEHTSNDRIEHLRKKNKLRLYCLPRKFFWLSPDPPSSPLFGHPMMKLGHVSRRFCGAAGT